MTSSTSTAATFFTAIDLSRDQLLWIQANEHETRTRRQEMKEMHRMLNRDEYAWSERDNEEEDFDDNDCLAITTAFDAIRQIPEIMLQLYSFLPVKDRIFTLSQVDKQFAGDKVRGGIRSGRYGPSHLPLREALSCIQKFVSSLEYEDEDEEEEDIAAVAKMIVRSTIIGDLDEICEEVYDRDARLSDAPHWMEDLVSLEQVTVACHGSRDKFNRLEELAKEAGCEEILRCYQADVEHVQLMGEENPRLDPGFVLMLPHSDKGREEHHAVTCSECNKLHLKHRTISCEHGHESNICKTCDQHAELIHSCSPEREHDVRCGWGCYQCRMKTNKKDVSRFREDICLHAAYDFGWQVKVETMLMQIEDFDVQERVYELLIQGKSPREAYNTPIACVDIKLEPASSSYDEVTI
jgi:hypothetical protein